MCLDRKIAIRLFRRRRSERDDFSSGSVGDAEDIELLTGRRKVLGTPIPLTARVTRALLYGISVFLSFFLMLVFMTYNAYLILAVVAGAFIGHFIFASEMDVEAVLSGVNAAKGMACH